MFPFQVLVFVGVLSVVLSLGLQGVFSVSGLAPGAVDGGVGFGAGVDCDELVSVNPLTGEVI